MEQPQPKMTCETAESSPNRLLLLLQHQMLLPSFCPHPLPGLLSSWTPSPFQTVVTNRGIWLTCFFSSCPSCHPTIFTRTQFHTCQRFICLRVLLTFLFKMMLPSHQLWLWPVCPSSNQRNCWVNNYPFMGKQPLPGKWLFCSLLLCCIAKNLLLLWGQCILDVANRRGNLRKVKGNPLILWFLVHVTRISLRTSALIFFYPCSKCFALIYICFYPHSIKRGVLCLSPGQW